MTWKTKIERPEDIYMDPVRYYTKEEVSAYAKSGPMKRAQQRLAKRIVELLNLKPPARILELGCGVGYSMEFLKSQGFDVTGIDVLDEMLTHARKKGLKVEKLDMRDIPGMFQSREFDCVVSVSAMQWIPINERARVAKGCYYVLKDHGKVGIQFYPKSEEEVMTTGRIFKRAGFDVTIVVDNPNLPRKRTIYLIGEKSTPKSNAGVTCPERGDPFP